MSKTPKSDLTAETLRHLFFYDARTGVFTWKNSARPSRNGTIAGSLKGTGYRTLKINQKEYQEGRCAWLYVHGEWPAKWIDHIDGCKTNNAIENLREASTSENAQNLCRTRPSRSGLLGVSWVTAVGKWRASIKKDDKLIFLGDRKTPEEAHQLYLDAKARLHTFCPVPRVV